MARGKSLIAAAKKKAAAAEALAAKAAAEAAAAPPRSEQDQTPPPEAPRGPSIPRVSLPSSRIAPGWFVGLAFVLLIVGAPWIRELMGHPRSDIHAVRQADAYNALINDLVLKRGWLEIKQRPDGEIRIQPSALAPSDAEGWKAFVRSSYLRVDMTEPGRWLFDDDLGRGARLTEIDPTAHQVLGPYAGTLQWRGDIQFRTGSSGGASLRRVGETRAFLFRPARGASEGGLTTATLNLFKPEEGEGQQLWPRRYRFVDEKEVADVIALDNQNALVRVIGGSPVVVTVAGIEASAGPGEVQYLRLPADRDLVFTRGERAERFVYEVAAPTVSRFEAVSGQRLRAPGLESFARSLEPAVTRRDDRPIVVTLDQRLQSEAESQLHAIVDQLPAAPAFRSAVTMMDGMTGEVLAIASLPTPPSDTTGDRADDTRGRHRFTTSNHNFDLMPVGSVAKAPLSMAILQTFPALATLEVRPGAPGFRELLGVDLGTRRADGMAFSDTVSGPAWMTFTRFLEASSNKYAAALMLLSLSDDPTKPDQSLPPAPTDCYRLGGTQFCQPPVIPILSGQPRGEFGIVPDMAQQRAVPWALELTRLFGVQAEFDRETPRRDTSVWQAKAGGVNLDSPALQALGLERESLGLNVIHDLKGDYLMSALGGGRSRWSTLRLAEVFSRMVLRRQVEARFLIDAERPPLQPLMIRDEAWKPMMTGLRAVVGPGGTGREITLPTAPEGQEYRIFAKTGTPNVDRQQALNPVDLAMMALAAYDCGLKWDTRQRQLTLADQPGTTGGLRRAHERVKPICRTVIDGVGVAALTQAFQRIDRMGAGGSAPSSLQVDRDTGRVLGVSPDAGFDAEKGHAIALVIARYAVGAPDDRPLRALTIAINVQQRSDAIHNPATKVAALLVQDRAVLDWLAQDSPNRVIG
ncbi:MAG: hypothetical protein EBR82_22670 [Caulobacteraceae bacterium]|nr:hypothetical protein [Caulobacteraceae bacterium]